VTKKASKRVIVQVNIHFQMKGILKLVLKATSLQLTYNWFHRKELNSLVMQINCML